MADFEFSSAKLARFQTTMPKLENSFLTISGTNRHVSKSRKSRYGLTKEDIKADSKEIKLQGDGDQVTLLHAYFTVAVVSKKCNIADSITVCAQLNSCSPRR